MKKCVFVLDKKLNSIFCFSHNTPESNTDEFIKERERYAIIGDDLDLAFVELIPGVDVAYNDRHPKPPTPPKEKS